MKECSHGLRDNLTAFLCHRNTTFARISMTRLIALFAFGVIFFAPGFRTHAGNDRAAPNIVLIFIDDLGYGDIGPFGNTKVRTPALDKFAAEGMKFTSFYATPVCSMSRACLMTGCYNARV